MKTLLNTFTLVMGIMVLMILCSGCQNPYDTRLYYKTTYPSLYPSRYRVSVPQCIVTNGTASRPVVQTYRQVASQVGHPVTRSNLHPTCTSTRNMPYRPVTQSCRQVASQSGHPVTQLNLLPKNTVTRVVLPSPSTYSPTNVASMQTMNDPISQAANVESEINRLVTEIERRVTETKRDIGRRMEVLKIQQEGQEILRREARSIQQPTYVTSTGGDYTPCSSSSLSSSGSSPSNTVWPSYSTRQDPTEDEETSSSQFVTDISDWCKSTWNTLVTKTKQWFNTAVDYAKDSSWWIWVIGAVIVFGIVYCVSLWSEDEVPQYNRRNNNEPRQRNRNRNPWVIDPSEH